MNPDKCINCLNYQAKKRVFNLSGKTGVCLEKAYPYNKVQAQGGCSEYAGLSPNAKSVTNQQ